MELEVIWSHNVYFVTMISDILLGVLWRMEKHELTSIF